MLLPALPKAIYLRFPRGARMVAQNIMLFGSWSVWIYTGKYVEGFGMFIHLGGNVWVILFCSSHIIHLLLLPYSFCMYINKWHPMQIYSLTACKRMITIMILKVFISERKFYFSRAQFCPYIYVFEFPI